MTDAVTHAIDLLERELHAERFGDHLDAVAERFGAPELVPVPTCGACLKPITKTAAGWWVHLGVTPCSRVVITVEEVEGR